MVITTWGQKGGGGKSTLATNLAVEGVRRRRKVLLVDLDTQGTAADWHETATAAHADNPKLPTPPALALHLHELGGYELVIIDVPAKHGDHQAGALLVADLAVLPCSPSFADVRALGRSLPTLRDALARRDQLRACVVMSRTKSAAATGRAREALAEATLPLLRQEIGDRLAYQEAMAAGQGVTTYAPRSPAAAEIRALYDELRRIR